MTIKEALDNIVTSGINLGAGDFVDPEALEVAARVLEKIQWISVKDRLPESDHDVLVAVSGRVGNITLIDSIEIASFNRDEGWILEMWPDWEDPTITNWMPLPDAPKEE